MKLLRYGAPGAERPGMLDAQGTIRDLSGLAPDIAGATLDPSNLRRLAAVDPASLPTVSATERLGPCVGGVGKILCVGLNYADHAAESGMPVPEEPILFMKATSAICGPNDPAIRPRGAEAMDWEVELAVIVGRRARHVATQDAMAHVAGYCVINDYSERDWQMKRGGQWVKGKSADSFAPLGPWLVTADDVPDPQNLRLWLEVDGQRRQDGTTRTMIFGVAELVAYVSRFMTLEPGDVIATGTPPGVGMGQKPPVYLRPGQVVRLGIEGLGEQRQVVVDEA